MQDRYLKDLEGPPEEKSRLQPLAMNTKVLIQNQMGKAPLRWDKTGVVVEILPFDQYVVKVNGSNRLTKRNRKFLRAYIPAFEQEESRFPHDQEVERECELDSAWGAMGHRTQSADSETGPGEEHIDTLPGVVDDVYFPEPEWEGSC